MTRKHPFPRKCSSKYFSIILFCSLNQNWDQWVCRPQLSASWEARSCLSEAKAKCSKFSELSFSLQREKYFGIAGKAFCLNEICLIHCTSYNYLKEKKLCLRYVGSQKLSEMLQQPYDLYKAGWADAYLMGLINQVGKKHAVIISSSSVMMIQITMRNLQVAQALDDSMSQEVTNHLFQGSHKLIVLLLTSSMLLPQYIFTALALFTTIWILEIVQNLARSSASTWSPWTSKEAGSTESPPTTGQTRAW